MMVERRWYGVQVAVAISLAVLMVRAGFLQVARGAYYRGLAEQNRLRLVPDPAPRGLIVDRRGRILASNHTVFRVAIIPQELEDLSSVLSHVGAVVHQPVDALQREYRRELSLAFLPATLVDSVPREAAIRLEEDRGQLPGLLVKPETVRDYPLGVTAAHLIGYLSQPTAEELPLLKAYGVRPKELVGRMGVERLVDHALRGRPGGLMVEVNHRARRVRVIGRRAPEAGARVSLTIDAPLQSLIEQAFGAQPGAAVVLDPNTGAVLAMVSVPAFRPSAFSTADAPAVQRLLNDPQAPLMNRATVGVYQPGSIIKLVTASAGLEHRLITPATTVPCAGALQIGDRAFHCWDRDGHGTLALSEAIAQSCNVYFMTLGRRLGAARLRTALAQIGFGRAIGWPLEEQPGHLPQRRLTDGEVALLAIGQGEILLTVLQTAVMASVFANKGWLVEPWVVSTVADRPVMKRSAPRWLGWSVETLDAVRTGMKAVVAPPDGTGYRAMSPLVSIAGKTGTAQTHIPGQTHGWFVGFCPVGQPKVAMALLAEHGGSGGDLPAEIARAICEYAVAPDTL